VEVVAIVQRKMWNKSVFWTVETAGSAVAAAIIPAVTVVVIVILINVGWFIPSSLQFSQSSFSFWQLKSSFWINNSNPLENK
jgi:fumarate reductase subunit D